MSRRKNTSKPDPESLRNASDPYLIHLEGEPYILSEEMLKGQVDLRLTRKKDWFFPRLKVLSYTDGNLKFQNIYRKESFEMIVHIEPDKLLVSCNCGMPVETLCIHSYKALEHLTWYGHTDYFKKYQPNGVMEIAAAHKKYFNRKFSKTGIDRMPKANLGIVYKLAGRFDDCYFNDIVSLPSNSAAIKRIEPKITAMAYVIMDASRERYLTFLLPCLGILTKPETGIKSFYPFITKSENEYDRFLSFEQAALHEICYEMHRLVENRSGSLTKEDIEQFGFPTDIFALWERALPILQRQEFIFQYCLFGKQALKEKPRMRDIRRLSVSNERPKLHFQLTDKGAFYQLRLKATINGRNLAAFSTGTTFFIKANYNLYLLSCLKDAYIIKWMQNLGGHITVFKEHFPEFENEYLNSLRESYQVAQIKHTPKTNYKDK